MQVLNIPVKFLQVEFSVSFSCNLKCYLNKSCCFNFSCSFFNSTSISAVWRWDKNVFHTSAIVVVPVKLRSPLYISKMEMLKDLKHGNYFPSFFKITSSWRGKITVFMSSIKTIYMHTDMERHKIFGYLPVALHHISITEHENVK